MGWYLNRTMVTQNLCLAGFEQPFSDLGVKQMNPTYIVEMYPTHTDVEYIEWTQITPQLHFEEAHTVSVTLGQCAPGYRYRIQKVERDY